MLASLRTMPWGVALFLIYGLLIMAGLGIALPSIVEQAIGAPLTFQGLVVMILLAYTIFTLTLVLQRKQAARQLALGLVSLTLPTALLLLVAGFPIPALFVVTLGLLLIRGLLRPEVRAWLSEA